jgi:hypothetical protein
LLDMRPPSSPSPLPFAFWSRQSHPPLLRYQHKVHFRCHQDWILELNNPRFPLITIINTWRVCIMGGKFEDFKEDRESTSLLGSEWHRLETMGLFGWRGRDDTCLSYVWLDE